MKPRGFPKAALLAHRVVRSSADLISAAPETQTTASTGEDWTSWQSGRGRVIWLYGRSGAGKSTLSACLAKRLRIEGQRPVILDGDDLRRGLNAGLGFSDADRTENIRRTAEVAKLFLESGATVIAALMTPLRSQRDLIREILGEDVLPVFVSVPWDVCASRDVKGLYAQAAVGALDHFAPSEAPFEEPGIDEDSVVVTAHGTPIAATLVELHDQVRRWIRGERPELCAQLACGEGI